jgi:hypothetical protein
MKLEADSLRQRGMSFVFRAVMSRASLIETAFSKTTKGDELNRPNN